MKLAILLIFTLYSVNALASNVFDELPASINSNARYVFYSHGFIVEGDNPTPQHPTWGTYDFPAILETLSELDAIIIAEHRAKNTDPFEHAKKLQHQVEHLIETGVPATNISLVGFSRGGFITAIASSYIANNDINYLILAACTSSLATQSDVILQGNIFSIYETSDTVGSCEKVVQHSGDKVTSFEEISISTGLEHGAFYRPIKAWVEPLNNWLEQKSEKVAYSIPRSELVELQEPISKRIYPLYIKLPRSYRSNKSQHYPVIYLTDAPYTFPIVSGATRFPMNSGTMEEAIIVGISYSKGSKGVSSRVRDFTPAQASDWKLETGGAKAHLRFIRKTLIPFVESNYRAAPEHRTYVGNSLGGLFGAYVLFTAPETFSGYVLGSPSVWFNDNELLAMNAQKPKNETKVYLSVGSLETPKFGEQQNMVRGARLLAEKINAVDSSHLILNFKTIEGASHAIAFPTTAIHGLDWIHANTNLH
ncbi:alpha/beta hydrolase [Paraglaciecola chathamensis]|uniref:alpha/beta hydrolase n=1 Tax=Paraglaciecola chathamensis TaxID=368405 RepID=UPI002989DC13|nr:alpha/beta hydrolase-fold protein [Paraglaciecola chathamensis]